MVSKDAASNLYDDTLKSARLSTVSRRYRPSYTCLFFGDFTSQLFAVSALGACTC